MKKYTQNELQELAHKMWYAKGYVSQYGPNEYTSYVSGFKDFYELHAPHERNQVINEPVPIAGHLSKNTSFLKEESSSTPSMEFSDSWSGVTPTPTQDIATYSGLTENNVNYKRGISDGWSVGNMGSSGKMGSSGNMGKPISYDICPSCGTLLNRGYSCTNPKCKLSPRYNYVSKNRSNIQDELKQIIKNRGRMG